MAKATAGKRFVNPEQIPLTKLQAERLSVMTGAPAKSLVGKKSIDLADEIRWSIDPWLWRYERVCGRVVKRDPATGAEYPVPNATVHIEDTDCNLILYSPPGGLFSWFYPIGCHREELASVITDACGHFCAWIPRWDIDWIRSWRAERICFPIIFERPSLAELSELPYEVPQPPPGPGPDPAPYRPTALAPGGAGRLVGGPVDNDGRADGPLGYELHPPLPEEFATVANAGDRRTVDVGKLIAANIAEQTGLEVKALASLDLRAVIGPFRRCVTEYIPVWTPVFDVPDITFRVTQDVDGDGTEEVIYSEGFFQVRWNASSIPEVTLEAASWARESRVCEAPPIIPCGNTPAINFAGMMPVTPAYHDNATGYATRPNRPRPGGIPTDPSTAPYCQNVNLFGCLPNLAGATQYRLLYRYATAAGQPFSSPLPFTLENWWWHPTASAPVQATLAAGTGWTPLPPAGLAGTPEESFLFPFDTSGYTPGLYAISVEIGNAAGIPLGNPSPEILFTCDNRAPTIVNQIRWSTDGGASWTTLPGDCPVVRRGVSPQDVTFQVTWAVMAPAHYRDSSIGSGGCGPSGTAPAPTPSTQPSSDWYTGPADNAMTYVTTYQLNHLQAEGTYSFGCHANSRAFNPSGNIANYQALDWRSDAAAPIYTDRLISFSVINAAP